MFLVFSPLEFRGLNLGDPVAATTIASLVAVAAASAVEGCERKGGQWNPDQQVTKQQLGDMGATDIEGQSSNRDSGPLAGRSLQICFGNMPRHVAEGWYFLFNLLSGNLTDTP